MGAIAYSYPSIPEVNNDPQAGPIVTEAYKNNIFARIYKRLQDLGLSIPATASDAISRADLITHLQVEAGALVRSELDTDPLERGYAGLNDADAAVAINQPFVTDSDEKARKLPLANRQGYRTLAGSSDVVLVCELRPSGGDPDFTTWLAPAGVLDQNAFVRFRRNTPTVALRGEQAKVQAVTNSSTIAIGSALSVAPGNNDRFDVVFATPDVNEPRVVTVLLKFPGGPNALTAQDIAGART